VELLLFNIKRAVFQYY